MLKMLRLFECLLLLMENCLFIEERGRGIYLSFETAIVLLDALASSTIPACTAHLLRGTILVVACTPEHSASTSFLDEGPYLASRIDKSASRRKANAWLYLP
jgi:hypothetical protein